jgi:hypothetical protein
VSAQYLIDPTPARPTLTSLEAFCLAIIRGRKGRERAIGQHDLAEHLGTSERHARLVVGRLINVHAYPICSSYDSRKGGYFWPRTQAEVERLLDQLDHHARAIYRRRGRLKRALKHIRDRVEQPVLEVQG